MKSGEGARCCVKIIFPFVFQEEKAEHTRAKRQGQERCNRDTRHTREHTHTNKSHVLNPQKPEMASHDLRCGVSPLDCCLLLPGCRKGVTNRVGAMRKGAVRMRSAAKTKRRTVTTATSVRFRKFATPDQTYTSRDVDIHDFTTDMITVGCAMFVGFFPRCVGNIR